MKSHHDTASENLAGGHDYANDERWRRKPLTPSQLSINDVRFETWRSDRDPLLEINERSPAALVPDIAAFTPSASFIRISEATKNPIERQKYTNLEEDFGWVRTLRLQAFQADAWDDSVSSARCRWIHCSSNFPEYIQGFLWALSNDLTGIADSMQMLELAVQRNTRYSKHGKWFVPFSQILQPQVRIDSGSAYPMLMSVPFLDWTVKGKCPPLRFNIDKREGYHAARSSSHVIRSILQYFYRLEDTQDREGSQVLGNHKPWSSNRELDLKVRSFYGSDTYPERLNVDELWILAVDAEHIVTWSSNQTWKSRWPPQQLTSRISDISFRAIRNHYFASGNTDYNALVHAVACLSGAVGLLHRNFWPDIVLCLVDRYVGRLGHLQYCLHRNPSTKLVMDLIACQEELNIVIHITEQQLDTIRELRQRLEDRHRPQWPPAPVTQLPGSLAQDDHNLRPPILQPHSTYRSFSTSELPDPLAQLLDNLQRELTDLSDLRDQTEKLVNRTIQLVNIRLEDNGKVILIFTIVTLIFLPLNFVSSFLGMNVSDIRNMEQTQWIFWAIAICVTFAVVGSSIVVAFYGADIYEKLLGWRMRRDQLIMR
jgi:Mg2+ and Co2+ transporter CorA